MLEGSRRFLGLAFEQPASLLNYLSENTLIAIDEPEQCHAHSDRWVENAEEQWRMGMGHWAWGMGEESTPTSLTLPKIHRSFDECLADIAKFKTLYLSELSEENSGINLSSRSLPVTPHQFAKLAETIRQERDRIFHSGRFLLNLPVPSRCCKNTIVRLSLYPIPATTKR